MERYQPFKIIFFLFLIFADSAFAATINVRSNFGISDITSALARAAPGDTVIVHKGIYKEKSIVISKPVVLIGKDYPVLDGQYKYEIISVFASDVTIDGFHLVNGGHSSMTDIAGIKLYNAEHVIVRNNILTDMFFGIYFQHCRLSAAYANKLTSNGNAELQAGNGIHCWKCDSMTIHGNKISGHRDGIYLEFATNSIISSNNSLKNLRYGLHFMFSHNNNYLSNIFQNNGAGVAVMYTHNVKMYKNIFRDNWGSASYGLLLKDISDSHVEGNIFSGNTVGIYMEGSNRIHISNNNFSSNGGAMKVQANCDNNVIEHNNFKSNTFDITTNGSLVLSSFSKNYWDKYDGYDLNHDNVGDVPYHPVGLYSMIIEQVPVAMIFINSFMVSLLEKAERAMPGITPVDLVDSEPVMKPIKQ